MKNHHHLVIILLILTILARVHHGAINDVCDWSTSSGSVGAPTPILSSNSTGGMSLNLVLQMKINPNVPYSHMLYIGSTMTDSTNCSVSGRMMTLYKTSEDACNVTYATDSLDINDLINDNSTTGLTKVFQDDYIKITIPIYMYYQQNGSSNQFGLCQLIEFQTEQVIYVKISGVTIDGLQISGTPDSSKFSMSLFQQSITTSGAQLKLSIFLQTVNATLNDMYFLYSTNPKVSIGIQEFDLYQSISQDNKLYLLSLYVTTNGNDFRSTNYFASNVTNTRTNGNASLEFPLTIAYQIVTAPSVKNFSITVSQTISDSSWNAKSTFASTDRLYSLVQTSSLLTGYSLRVVNAYICCYTSVISTPIYDPSNGQYGCKMYDSSTMDSWNLLVNNTVASTDYQTSLTSFPAGSGLTGFSFDLSKIYNRPTSEKFCFLQTEAKLVKVSRRSLMEVVAGSGSDVSTNFKVQRVAVAAVSSTVVPSSSPVVKTSPKRSSSVGNGAVSNVLMRGALLLVSLLFVLCF